MDINREPRCKINEWNREHHDVQRNWIPVDDTEKTGFIGLNLLPGLHKSNHEPISSLWSENKGRPVFTATASSNRFTIICGLIIEELLKKCVQQSTRRLFVISGYCFKPSFQSSIFVGLISASTRNQGLFAKDMPFKYGKISFSAMQKQVILSKVNFKATS